MTRPEIHSRYDKSEKGKARRRRYEASQKYKLVKKRYRSTPEGMMVAYLYETSAERRLFNRIRMQQKRAAHQCG